MPETDVVGEAVLLADRQEQAAAHPVAEDRVEHAQGPGVGVVARQRRHADGRAAPGRVSRSPEQDALAGRQRGARLEGRDDAVAGPERPVRRGRPPPRGRGRRRPRRRRSPAGRSPPRSRGSSSLGRHADAGLVAADLAAERRRPRTSPAGTGSGRTRPGRRGSERISSTMTCRSRSISCDVEERPDDQLAEHVHRPLGLAPRHADPVDGRLAVRGRVERAADALDRLGDGARRRVGRACP